MSKLSEKVEKLSAACVDAVSEVVDWSQIGKEGDPLYSFFESYACETCGERSMCGEPCRNWEPCRNSECMNCDGPESEEPMIDRFYPLYSASEEDALAVTGPLLLVQRDGGRNGSEWGLALTGGGMDLTWEICEAYIALGYLPPAELCDLPAMAGCGSSARDKLIMSACERSLSIMRGRLECRAGSIASIRKKAAQREREKRASDEAAL